MREISILGALAVIVLISGVGLHAAWREFDIERQERDAGYTTLFGRRYRRYWHLDPKTGAVIRPPES